MGILGNFDFVKIAYWDLILRQDMQEIKYAEDKDDEKEKDDNFLEDSRRGYHI